MKHSLRGQSIRVELTEIETAFPIQRVEWFSIVHLFAIYQDFTIYKVSEPQCLANEKSFTVWRLVDFARSLWF